MATISKKEVNESDKVDFVKFRNEESHEKFSKFYQVAIVVTDEGSFKWKNEIAGVGMWPQSMTNRTEYTQYWKVKGWGESEYLGHRESEYILEKFKAWKEKKFGDKYGQVADDEFMKISDK